MNELMNQSHESNLPAVSEPTATTQIEQSRAVQEVQAKLVIAKKFPRDTIAARARIMENCKRLTLAKVAIYNYPRGGQNVSGPSIRLAEVMAQNYGNLEFGVRELERKQGRSMAQAYCWDLETNVTSEKTFEIPHEMQLKNGTMKRLTDPRDIYEIVANNGARRMRACILAVIPGDIVEEAVNACRATNANGDGERIETRITKMLMAFKELGVSQEMLEGRLMHPLNLTTGEELADLLAVYTTIKDKQAKRGDFFNFPDDSNDGSEKANSFSEKLRLHERVKEPDFSADFDTPIGMNQ